MKKYEIEINGKTLSIQTGQVARQSSGSVIVQYGETTILTIEPIRKNNVHSGYRSFWLKLLIYSQLILSFQPSSTVLRPFFCHI